MGGLTARKGAPYILEVAKELAARKSPLRIAVAGSSWPAYREQAAALSNIVELGYVGIDRLPQALRGAVALMHLSRSESFGIPVIEAMAAGTPAVVSQHMALPEVAGDAGIVMDVAKPGEIAELLEQMHRNPGLRAEPIARGRRRAELFRWSRCVERLVGAFSGIMPQPIAPR